MDNEKYRELVSKLHEYSSSIRRPRTIEVPEGYMNARDPRTRSDLASKAIKSKSDKLAKRKHKYDKFVNWTSSKNLSARVIVKPDSENDFSLTSRTMKSLEYLSKCKVFTGFDRCGKEQKECKNELIGFVGIVRNPFRLVAHWRNSEFGTLVTFGEARSKYKRQLIDFFEERISAPNIVDGFLHHKDKIKGGSVWIVD